MARPGYHDPAYDATLITGEATPLPEPWQERIAALLRGAREGLNRGGFAPGHPLNIWKSVMDRGLSDGRTGLMAPADQPPPGLGTALVPDPESWSRWGRGDAPYTTGETGLAGRLPMLKPGRAADALNIASTLPLGAAGDVGGAIGAVRKVGDVMPEKVAKELAKNITGDSQFGSRIYDKLVQWLIRSAGRDDPALTGSRPWITSIENHPEVVNLYRQWGDEPDWAVKQAQEVAAERGLPQAPAGTMQEVVDAELSGAFKAAATPADVKIIPEYFSEEFGMKPENIRKLGALLPEDAVIARSYIGVSGIELREQLGELRKWAADQPLDKLEKMTIPQMFQAREKDMVRALKEFEKSQRGEVQMRFPETEEKLEWQKLGARHLKREGKEMSHCVGSYCEDVESGKKEIYSLRTRDNRSRVTLELDKVEPSFLRFKQALSEDETDKVNAIHQRLREEGKASTLEYVYKQAAPEKWKAFMEDPQFQVVQIKGNANSVPAKYYEQVKALLDAKGWDYEGSYDWNRLKDAAAKVEGPEALRRAADDPDFADGWQVVEGGAQ